MASRRRFQWDGARYRDRLSGRYIRDSAVRAAIDYALRAEAQRMTSLAADLRSGRLSLSEWRTEMQRALREIHSYSAAAARGGWRHMDQRAWGMVGARVREQRAYLDRLAVLVANGLPVDGSFTRRAKMYADAGRTTYEEAHRDIELRAGRTQERNILKDRAKHCGECPAETARGWVPIGTLSYPGGRQCLGNCRCRLVYR